MEKQIRILHLEDNDADTELIQARLEAGNIPCRITIIKTGDEFTRVLHEQEFDIILADYRLPGYDGITALRLSKKLCPYTPFIFVSGTLGEDAAIECLIQGATDYVLKQKLSRLVPAVKRALREVEIRRERQHAEESIRKLSQAIEQSPVSIVITDTEGSIEFVNVKYTQVTGYSYNETIGQNPRILKSGETSDKEYRRLWETISSGGVWEGEFHNRKKNGELFWEHTIISSVRNEGNVITHYVAVKEDITERKKLEEQFRQSQKMEAIGQLAGGVAHDFNNMLGVIIGHAEIALEKATLDVSLQDNLQQILATGLRSAELTRQLLAFARKQTIRPKVLDLNETVEGMLKLLRRLIGEDIDLVWVPATNLWPIKMDPTQIDQILANLCVNAKDSISGVGKITVETQNVHFDEAYCTEHEGFSPGKYVMLAVNDNGHGIDKLTIEKIFEPFFTTKEIGRGTGLGLSTVYGIIKQNNGFINVYSEPKHGSTFKICLPRYSVSTEKIQNESTVVSKIQGSETILLVEDNYSVLTVSKEMLEKLGYFVLTSLSPEEAISLASKNRDEIDLLITDMAMPVMSGIELEKKIKSICPELKCLFMSGHIGDHIAHHGFLDDNVNFIQKPFTTKKLAAKVREVLDKK